MITYNTEKIKSNLTKSIEAVDKVISTIKYNIHSLKDFSSILHVQSIRKVDNVSASFDILYLIKAYEISIQMNDFDNLKCPLCRHKYAFCYHKEYTRNIIFYVDQYEITAKIYITVLECSFCKQCQEAQHFHAILPDFIFPYHIYSSILILGCLYERLIEKAKIETIIEKRNISHQLFYKWLRGLEQYKLSSSTILGIEADIKLLIVNINNNPYSFLNQFYQTYYHPFFLFKVTCIPLVIIP